MRTVILTIKEFYLFRELAAQLKFNFGFTTSKLSVEVSAKEDILEQLGY